MRLILYTFNGLGSKAIEKDLSEGMTVIADRYAFSGIAFSAAKVSFLSHASSILPGHSLFPAY